MSLSPGTTLGPYEVLSAIGAGGMGEVYKARDTKLDRDVALKILPDAFVNDPERLARFQREAKVLASLNHPNIAAIYGLEESGDSPALVLEYVPGPTLQDRIAKGPIPLDEALPIARQIAEALEAAHEQGIIHRDLKPANVKVKTDGTVKVLDFGLAKALEPDLSDLDAANSPTMTMTAAATKMGVIMGTAAYMSPEQAKGRQVDKRADVWAFGVVLYEMLTGRQAFGGTDISETLAAVLMREIDMTALPTDTPASVRRMLRRCVTRDRKNRLADMSMARLDIDDAGSEAEAVPVAPDGAPTAPIAQPALWQRPAAIAAIAFAALVLGTLIAGAVAGWNQPPPNPPLVVRVPIPLGEGEGFTNTGRRVIAIAPDGSHLAYAAGGIVLRPLGQLQATLIPGTSEGGGSGRGRGPFFAPGGQWLGFWQQGQLRKVAISGGAPITLAEVENPYGASWGDDDTILFGRGPDGIWQVPGTGGTPEPLIAVEDGEEAYGPQMLPGGEWVLFTVRLTVGGWDEAQIVAASVATGERQVLVAGGRDARYVATGHLVYLLNNVLFAVPFDATTRVVTGGPVSLVEGVPDGGATTGAGHFDLSRTGSLVYISGRAGGGVPPFDLVWVDRTGAVEPVRAEPRPYRNPEVSPDGAQVAVRVDSDNSDIWTYDLARGTLTRLTFDEADDRGPAWTPDGARVVFQSDRDGGGLFWKAADGTGAVEQLLEFNNVISSGNWSSDGRLVVNLGGDIGVLTVDGDRTVDLLLDTEFNEGSASVSPNGRWLAYQSDESGKVEVYVRPFPDVETGKWQVSAGGGGQPLWSPDGAELFFLSFDRTADNPNNQIMVAQVEGDPTFRHTTPERLFDLADLRFDWGIAPDGRFLMTRLAAAQGTDGGDTGLVFVEHWFSELQARVPTGR